MPHSWSLRSTKYPDGLAIKTLSMVVEELTHKEGEKGRMLLYIYEIIINYEWDKVECHEMRLQQPRPSSRRKKANLATLLELHY